MRCFVQVFQQKVSECIFRDTKLRVEMSARKEWVAKLKLSQYSNYYLRESGKIVLGDFFELTFSALIDTGHTTCSLSSKRG